MRVLVTGGAGFIGSHLVEALVKQKHTVTVLDNLRSGKKENIADVQSKITFIQGDINDSSILSKAIEGQDCVFHLAAIASVPYSVEHPQETHLVNATGTLNVLLGARGAGVKKFVYSSTAAVYGDEPTMPKTEKSPIKPQTPYALTKLMGENYVHLFHYLYKMDTVSLRFFNVYGPRQDPSSPYSGVITKFVSLIKKKESPVIFGDGMQTRDFVYVTDVVNALILAMEKGTSGMVFNIGTGIQASVNELLIHLKELFQSPVNPIYDHQRQGDILHSVADITLAQKLLGYSPKTPIHEGLEETFHHKSFKTLETHIH